jgi:hypothetical protein
MKNSYYFLVFCFFICSFTIKNSHANKRDSLNISEIIYKSERIFKKRFINLSALGFANNEYAANKRLNINKSIRILKNPTVTPTEISNSLNNASDLVEHAKAVYKKVKDERLFVSSLEGINIDLPFGIAKTVGQREYIICIDSIVLTPTHAYAVVYSILEHPNTGDTIAFGAKVTLSPDGGFASDGGKLLLLSNKKIKLGEKNSIEFIGTNNNTFIEFDCNGYLGLNAEMLITLLKGEIVLETDENMDLSFTSEFYYEDFDNWLLTFENIPAFQFKHHLKGFTFKANLIVFDHDLANNPQNFVFPPNYSEAESPLWEGFCIEGLTVKLPEEFVSRNSTSRISFSVENAVIDNIGFTGKISGTDLIVMPEGNADGGDMNGWDYSLTRLSIKIFKNTFNEADFEGKIKIPVTDGEQVFSYNAIIQPGGNYYFSVEMEDNINFPLWGGSEGELYADSELNIIVNEGKFIPEAILSGNLNISASIGSNQGENDDPGGANSLELASINFQRLHVSSREPYLFLDPANGAFNVGSTGLSQKLAKLPVTISHVGLVTDNTAGQNHTGVEFTLRINLTGNMANSNSNIGFGANTTAIIWGEKPERRWQYYRCELTQIEIEKVELIPLTIEGYLQFFRDDPYYGTGFTGSIIMEIELKEGNGLGLEVAAIFGKIMSSSDPNEIDYRYWAVDAFMDLPVEVPLYPGLLYANGFGGGVSYHMDVSNEIPHEALYVTNSGTGLFPNRETGLGLRAIMGIQGQEELVYNGEVNFEILFDETSVENVRFSGYVAFAANSLISTLEESSVSAMAEKVKSRVALNKQASASEVNEKLNENQNASAIMAQWLMEMDFAEKTFIADIGVYVDVGGIITGAGQENYAGGLDILFAPDEWHINMGTASNPMGLKLSLLGEIESETYLSMGSSIPAPMGPPDGYQGSTNFSSNITAGSVKGFGHGTRLGLEFSRDGTFYYILRAGLGYDILVQNVSGKVCQETGESFGIKNWYASGIMYLYVDAEAGLEVCINVPYLKCNKFWKSSCWGTKEVCADEKITANFSASVSGNAPNPTNLNYNMSFLGKNVGLQIGESCTF